MGCVCRTNPKIIRNSNHMSIPLTQKKKKRLRKRPGKMVKERGRRFNRVFLQFMVKKNVAALRTEGLFLRLEDELFVKES